MGVLAAIFLFTALAQDLSSSHGPVQIEKVNTGASMAASLGDKIIRIPRIDRAPKLEYFESMSEPGRRDLLKISGFVERSPNDGNDPTQRPEVYIGYDHQNLYVVWRCFDKKPVKSGG